MLVPRRIARGTALRNSQSKQCSSGASWLGGVGERLKIWVTGGMLGQHGGYILTLMKFIDGGLLP